MTPQFPRILLWHVVRAMKRRPALVLLNVFSVALGIAVYLAIQIANHSAKRSFVAGIDLVAGKAHLEIRGDVDETLWPVVAAQPGVADVTAVVEGTITFSDRPGEYLRVIGLDGFTGEQFRTFDLHAAGKKPALEKWMGAGGAIAVTAAFARRQRLEVGDRLHVVVNSESAALEVAALIDDRDTPGGLQERHAVMDIGWAQELFGRQGYLSSLQIIVDEPRRTATVAAQLDALLPPGLRAEPPRQRSFQIESMLSAFQLNLTALSMVSLLVGVFLIYNTISASVARRRTEIGILRALGTTRWEIRALFLGEACILGLLGIVAGSAGGVALAGALTGTVARTISSLYLLVQIDRPWLAPGQFATAALFGLGAVFVGAWRPANEAARVDPVEALSLGTHAARAIERIPRLGWIGVALLLLALLASGLALGPGPAPWSFVAAFLVLAGFALVSPAATWRFGMLAARLRGAGLLWRLAADHLRRSIHRHAVTVAALAAAIAMMIGLMVMIFSFRRSVDAWISHGIVADLFIAPASNETIGLEAAVPSATIAWLRSRTEVGGVDTFREIECEFTADDSPAPRIARLAVVGGEYRHNLTFRGGGDVEKMARVFCEGCVAITEPFARRFGVRDGDRITLPSPRGPVEVEVAGTYADYTRDQGVILMARERFDRWWSDPRVHSLAVYLRPGAAAEPLAEAFRERFSRGGEFAIYSNRALRQRILGIFDQTFAVTLVLRTVAILVAMAGTFLALTTLSAEREREIGMLRATGASRGQVRGLLMIEAGMIGAIATLLGVAAGLVLATVLIHVVNPAFFGWTIALHLPWTSLLATPLWIIPAALVAAWYPAWCASRQPIAATIREE